MDNTDKVKDILSKMKNFKNTNLSFFNKINNIINDNMNIKLYLHYIMTLLYNKEKKYKESDIYVNKITTLLKDKKDIPYYIIDLLIYIFLNKINNAPNLKAKTKIEYNNIIYNLIKNKKTNIKI